MSQEIVPSEKICPGPICQGAPRARTNFRSQRSTYCRSCEGVRWSATRHTRGTAHRGLVAPTICALCGMPEVILDDDGKARKLVMYFDATTRMLRGFVCATCDRLLADANHSVRRFAQAILFLTTQSPLDTPAVVDVTAT